MYPQFTTPVKKIGRPKGPTVTRTCPQCGKQDQVIPTKLRNPYCSKSCSNASRAIPADVRFWRLVERRGPDECWPWTAARDHGEYGLFTLRSGKQQMANRFAFEATYRPLTEDERACHTCDNPPCCNPAHLFAGTVADNNEDKWQKARHPHGESHPRARLTWTDVHAIRARYKPRVVTAAMLAAEYGIQPDTIYDIVTFRSWADDR